MVPDSRDAQLSEAAEAMTGLSEFTATPEPLTFEELVWACDICGWFVELCPEHAAMARDIGAEQESDARREDER